MLTQREPLFGRQLLVTNLPALTWQEIKERMKSAGEIVRVNVMSPEEALVLFTSSRDAKKAIRLYDGADWDGRVLGVQLDESLNRKMDNEGDMTVTSQRVFVSNLSFRVGWQDLKDLFREAGDVTRADIKTDHANKSRGYGTVTFATVEGAREAIRQFDGFEWFGRKIQVREDRSGEMWTVNGTNSHHEHQQQHQHQNQHQNQHHFDQQHGMTFAASAAAVGSLSSATLFADPPGSLSSSSSQYFVSPMTLDTMDKHGAGMPQSMATSPQNSWSALPSPSMHRKALGMSQSTECWTPFAGSPTQLSPLTSRAIDDAFAHKVIARPRGNSAGQKFPQSTSSTELPPPSSAFRWW